MSETEFFIFVSLCRYDNIMLHILEIREHIKIPSRSLFSNKLCDHFVSLKLSLNMRVGGRKSIAVFVSLKSCIWQGTQQGQIQSVCRSPPVTPNCVQTDPNVHD